MRVRRIPAVFAVISTVLAGAAILTGRAVERRITRLLVEQAPDVAVRDTRFSWFRPLRLEGISWNLPSGGQLQAQAADVSWSFAGGRDARRHLRGVTLHGLRVKRGDLAVEASRVPLEIVAWERDGTREHIRVRQPGGGALELKRSKGVAQELSLSLADFDLSQIGVEWNQERVLAPGIWNGQLELQISGTRLASTGSLRAREARLALPAIGREDGTFGAPTSVVLAWDVTRVGEDLELRRAEVEIADVALSAHGRVASLASERRVDLALSARGELASAFAATGAPLPNALARTPGELGTASFEATVRGPLARPAALEIVPRLQFEVAPQATARLAYLRGPFHYAPQDAPGLTIDLRHGAATFVPLGEVPPLFLRALLISEDAGFYGHPGVDVVEIPVAFAQNLERGEHARGASTITQQLVKNLFLSRQKSYSRKLEEAALALLVDAAVPKQRLLEIYLNVIEWGPRLHGVGPAARHYFGKAPHELTAKETAFLICLIPSPVRYHQAHTAGRAGPGMERLMGNLLAKLHSVAALSDEEYLAALDETLSFAPETTPAPPAVLRALVQRTSLSVPGRPSDPAR